jgi:UV DNA damage endonuclease
MSQRISRLGFPVKVMGKPDLKSNDARRPANNPHLKVSLGYIDQILDYCAENRVGLYRMASDIAPYATHPDMPQFHSMVRESAAELAAIGAKAKALGIRLSFHPSQFIVLNSPDAGLVTRSVRDLSSQAEMLDLMGLGPEAVLVIHVGGVYGDVLASRERWVRTWETLPEPVRRRLVLEHDDVRFSASDTLWIHARTGVRLVFDHQHFWCLNPEGLDLGETLRAMVRTWPCGEVAKIHYSSPRTAFREQVVADRATGRKVSRSVAPVMTAHADFINPFEFVMFLERVAGVEFDVMLEAKAKDLALFRLREDLRRYGGVWAARFGLATAGHAGV